MAATIAVAGMNPMRWLCGEDPFERGVIQRIAERRLKIAEEERQDLAGRIVATLTKNIKVK